MKILIDIGAYNGDTLKDAVKHDYDIIHCIEPSPQHASALLKLAEKLGSAPWTRTKPTIIIHNYGLGDVERTMALYSSGSDGASVYHSKPQPAQTSIVDAVNIVPANIWFHSTIPYGEQVHMKINCEGSEIDILNSLIDGSEIANIDELCVYYDCVKVPGIERSHLAIEDWFNLNYRVLPNRTCIVRQTIIHGPNLSKPFVRNWLNSINKL